MPADPFSNRSGGSRPEKVPATGNPELEAFLERELMRLSEAIQAGGTQYLTLPELQSVPPRVFNGFLGYFAAGVVGGAAGVYCREGGAWVKL